MNENKKNEFNKYSSTLLADKKALKNLRLEYEY